MSRLTGQSHSAHTTRYMSTHSTTIRSASGSTTACSARRLQTARRSRVASHRCRCFNNLQAQLFRLQYVPFSRAVVAPAFQLANAHDLQSPPSTAQDRSLASLIRHTSGHHKRVGQRHRALVQHGPLVLLCERISFTRIPHQAWRKERSQSANVVELAPTDDCCLASPCSVRLGSFIPRRS